MRKLARKVRTTIFPVFCLVAIIAISGCTVTLVSNYDEKTDADVTQLQKNVETFLVTVEGQSGLPECVYDNHKNFYQKTVVEISAIDVRARAIPNNEITIEQVRLLKENLHTLEQIHKMGCFDPEAVEIVRNSFNSSFTAILKLELAKKRGE